MNSVPFLHDVVRDTHLALRRLWKSPGFSVTAVLTLALGIGTATAMFAIVYGVLLQPLPFPNSQQLYQPVGIDGMGKQYFAVPYGAIQQWREAVNKTAEIAFTAETQTVIDTPSGAQQIGNIGSSSNLLTTLGVLPILGRNFLPEESEDSKSQVVLLSYTIWSRAFSADKQILGKTVHIDGVPYSVIGVMPPHFVFPVYEDQTEVWTPLEHNRLSAANTNNSSDRFYPLVRVERGINPLAVQAELTTVQARIAQAARLGDEVATRIRLPTLRDSLVKDIRPALIASEIAVMLVWLIGCFNVAGLLLARVVARRMEIAVRGALGAGRLRIIQQFLTESLLLSSAGAIAGLGLAMFLLRAFRRMLQQSLPLSVSFHLNWDMVAVLIGLTLLTSIAFGAFPAAIAANPRTVGALKSGTHSTKSDPRQTQLSDLLLVCEVGVSVILLVAAGLMMRTVLSLQQIPLGFRTDHIVLTNLTIPGYLYKDIDVNTAAWQPLLERIQHLPEVQNAALSSVLPIGHSHEWLTLVYKTDWTNGNVSAVVRAASSDLLQVLGLRLRAGRFLSTQDAPNSMPVAIVNQTFVNQYLGGHDALGKQFRFGRVPSEATIVGVVEDMRQEAITTPSRPEFYICMAQLKPANPLYLPLMGRSMQIAVRTHNAPGAMIPELSRTIREQNSHLVLGKVTTMDQSVEDSIGSQRLAAGVIGTFGMLALLITAVGLYGLLTYAVTQRAREIGIRMALGADLSQVVSIILWKAFSVMGVGISIGLVLSFWTSRFLRSFLFGVRENDPWMLVLGPAILLAVGILAALIPARRAASIDPMQALRIE